MALRQAICCKAYQAVLQKLLTPTLLLGQGKPCLSNTGQMHTDTAVYLWGNFYSRGFHKGSILLKDIDVEIQAMGESITEGTIAEVLKKEGDSVDEDETIAQIETDKVTIDVKAPSAGTIKELKVSPDDTVKVGQLVAVISEGQSSGSEASSPASDSSSDSKSRQEDKQSAKSGQQQKHEGKQESSAREQESVSGSGQDAGDHESERPHKPMVKFPPRMTPDGRRISELPAEEQQQFATHSTGEEKHSSKAPSQSKPSAQPAKSFMPWYAGKEQGTKLSQSKVLSQYEMDQIELGGADP